MPCTRHRLFLAALIIAAKYLNDSSPKNSHWAHYACLFDVSEVNLMEKQLLFLLDYDLRFDEKQAIGYWQRFMSESPNQQEARAQAVDTATRASKARVARMSPSSSPSSSRPSSALSEAPSSSSSSSSLSCSGPSSGSRMPGKYLRPPTLVRSPSDKSYSSDGSEMAALTDDNDSSSSGSSMGWSSSSDSGSESELEHNPRRQSSVKFSLNPIVSKHSRSAARARMPSDTSSVRTITASLSPGSIGSMRKPPSGKRLVSGEPVLRSASSGGFLSRMWGAATGGAKDKMGTPGADAVDVVDPEAHQVTSAFKRLVMVHSRASIIRRGVEV